MHVDVVYTRKDFKLKNLSTLLCIPNEAVYRSNLYRMADCLMMVALEGYSGVAPEFEGGLKAVTERVAYTAGVTVNAMYPRPPPPTGEVFEASLRLILSKILTRDL